MVKEIAKLERHSVINKRNAWNHVERSSYTANLVSSIYLASCRAGCSGVFIIQMGEYRGATGRLAPSSLDGRQSNIKTNLPEDLSLDAASESNKNALLLLIQVV